MRGRSAFMFWNAVLLVSLVLLITSTGVFAQTGRITGRIVDAASGQPLAYANVVVVGTSRREGERRLRHRARFQAR